MKLPTAAALIALSLAGCKASTHTPPGADDVTRIGDLFGFGQAMDLILESSVRELSSVATPAQRRCVKDGISPLLHGAVDERLRQLFETRENIDAWIEFSHTAPGGTVLGKLRERTLARARGESTNASDIESALDGLTAGEREQVDDFLKTDAGLVLKKDWPTPDFDAPPEQLKSIARDCGLLR